MPTKALYQVSLKAFLKNANGELPILGVDDGGTYSGYYDVPGGRIHDDEFHIPLTSALAREIREEIGTDAFSLEPFPVAVGRHQVPGKNEHVDHDVQVLYIFFAGQIRSEEIHISAEHTSFQWVKLESIDTVTYFTSGIREGVEMYL